MSASDSVSDLRCFCAKRPLLARAGRDDDGSTFAHIKIFKAGKVYGEVVLEHGCLKLRCRECGRWHSLTLRRVAVDFEPDKRPTALTGDDGAQEVNR